MITLLRNSLAIAIVLFCFHAKGQILVGVQAGYGMSKILDKGPGSTFKFVPTAGIVTDIFLNDLFSIQPSFFYTEKSFGQTAPNIDYTYKLQQIEIPVHLALKFGLATRFTAFAGPYMAYNITGRMTEDIAATKTQIKDYGEYNLRLGSNVSDQFKKFDIGVSAGSYLIFDSGLFFKAFGRYGLSNIKPNKDVTAANYLSFGLAAGFFFM